jgi:hypothetical protein
MRFLSFLTCVIFVVAAAGCWNKESTPKPATDAAKPADKVAAKPVIPVVPPVPKDLAPPNPAAPQASAPAPVAKAAPVPPKPAAPAASAAAPKPPEKPAVPPFPAVEVVKEWNFLKLAAEKRDWKFPGDSKIQTKTEGVIYYLTGDQPGPVVKKLNLDAEKVDGIRIDEHLRYLKPDNSSEPLSFKGVRVYWASPADVKANPKWPYSKERVINLRVIDPAMPAVWGGLFKENPAWKGAIDSIIVMPDVPEEKLKDKADKFRVGAVKHELLKLK